ncbi:phosphoheptose isomerase [alpha proteobacterium AAP38]|nr:phosphoheptose isomerase [alpha proteobacterium AAP38]
MLDKFPAVKFDDAAEFTSLYFKRLYEASQTIQPGAMRAAADLLGDTVRAGNWVYACGNGGSAAICNHLHCDFAKGIRTSTNLRPRIHSLSAHLEMITAIGNDFSYDDIYAFQLSGIGQPGDLLITISSSGNSENIVRPLQWARDNGLRTIALTGFDGGRSARLANVNIHVAADNYGIVEDTHQSVMHILAQYLRQEAMPADSISCVRF